MENPQTGVWGFFLAKIYYIKQKKQMLEINSIVD
jgi:hypothetical protein